jgi:hypothetical protein
MTKFFTTALNTVSPSSSNKDRDVAFWPFSDVVGPTDDFGSWGQSGLTTDIAETTRMTVRPEGANYQ